MRFRQPPKLAVWILRTFGCHPDNEALMGDIYERFLARQSSIWYWKETLIAILNSLARETWGHKRHSAMAVVVGWLALGMIWFVLERVSGQPFAWSRHVCTFFWFIAGIGSGFVVGLLTTHRKRPMIFLFATSVALFLLVLHRPPASHIVFYWIDTIVLTLSISLAAVPVALPARQAIAPTQGDAFWRS